MSIVLGIHLTAKVTTEQMKDELLRSVETQSGAQLTVAKLPDLLQIFAKFSDIWSTLLSRALIANAGKLSLVCYHDATTPGNPMNLLQNRKATLVYVSFREFGHNLRHKWCWLPIAVCREKLMESRSGIGHVIKQVLKSILKDESCICAQGTAIKLNGDQTMPIKVNLVRLIADELALKTTFGVRGANGLRLCMLGCKNVIRTKAAGAAERRDGYFLHCWDSCHSRFEPMTNAFLYQSADNLNTQVENGLHGGRLESEQKFIGITHDPHGFLLDAELRRLCQPSIACFDALHCLIANGTFTSEIRMFFDELASQQLPVTPESCRYVLKLPWVTVTSLGASTPTSRCTRFDLALKGKAQGSELLELVPYVDYFVKKFVSQFPSMTPFCQSLVALMNVIRHWNWMKLQTFDGDCSAHKTEFRDMVGVHLDLFVKAYGKDEVVPKHHLSFHLLDHAEEDGIVIDCFVLERKHTTFKDIAEHCCKLKDFEKTTLVQFIQVDLSILLNMTSLDGLVGPTVRDGDCVVGANAQLDGVQVCRDQCFISRKHEIAMTVILCFQRDGDDECYAMVDTWRLNTSGGHLHSCSLWSALVPAVEVSIADLMSATRLVFKGECLPKPCCHLLLTVGMLIHIFSLHQDIN